MNKKSLTVSIVIPVFNDEDHLKACLESISRQTEHPDEVIIVDNNCTDNSVEVAKQFSFVKIVKETQQGVMYARDKGFNSAKSDIIGRIDADTQLPEDWVKKVKIIFENGEIDAVSGPTGWHDAPARQLGTFLDKNIRQMVWRLGARNDAIFLFGSNMAITKKAWDAVKGEVCLRKDVHEDIDLALHLFEKGFTVAFDGSLDALASSRRMHDSAEQLKKYVDVYKNTYEVHGIKSSSLTLTKVIVLSTHYGVKLIKRGYDPETRQFSLRRFIENEPEQRVHPM